MLWRVSLSICLTEQYKIKKTKQHVQCDHTEVELDGLGNEFEFWGLGMLIAHYYYVVFYLWQH